MNNKKTERVFNRSGLAALSELQAEECRNIFSVLEKRQSEFLREAGKFRSKEYKFPNDPLHCWSRVWEYPYVYFHLTRFVNGLTGGSRPVVADVGSGVTFFPFSLAQLGCQVVCTDIDPVCEKDILRACEFVSYSPGNVHFRLISNERLPFADCECDVIYCISVLEHIPNFENTVREIARVLKPGGLCLITCDIGLDPRANTPLTNLEYERLIFAVERQFRLLCPDRSIHPVNVLTDLNSPYTNCQITYARIGFRLLKQQILKLLFGRKPRYVNVLGIGNLAILGLVLEKR